MRFACYFIWRRDLQRQRLFIANIRRRADRRWKVPLLEGNDIRIHERNKGLKLLLLIFFCCCWVVCCWLAAGVDCCCHDLKLLGVGLDCVVLDHSDYIWRRDLQRQRLFIAYIRRRADRHWKVPLLEGNEIRIHERNKGLKLLLLIIFCCCWVVCCYFVGCQSLNCWEVETDCQLEGVGSCLGDGNVHNNLLK